MINFDSIADGHPSKPELSPWAQKFGLSRHPFFRSDRPDGLAHSGLAPSHPNLPVSDYNLPDDLKDDQRLNVPFPSNNTEADALFYAELEQMRLWKGCKSWQVPVINEKLYQGFPGGLQDAKTGWDAYTRLIPQLITVDESKWFSFFRKENWLDLRRLSAKQGVARPLPDPYWHAYDGWSVDNDAVWTTLRISIELANRILKQLIAEENHWLVALLTSNLEHITSDNTNPNYKYLERRARPVRLKRALNKFRDYQHQTLPKRPGIGHPPIQPQNASEALELYLNGLVFYFLHKANTIETRPPWGCTSAFTRSTKPGFPHSDEPDVFVGISTQHLEASFDTAANPAERCAGMLTLAVTVTICPFNTSVNRKLIMHTIWHTHVS